MIHFHELSEKTKAVITKTVFLLRLSSLWVSYLSQPHSYFLAAREGFEKHSLSIKGLFHPSLKPGIKFLPYRFSACHQSAQDTPVQQNWNWYPIVNLLQLAPV